VKCNLLTKTNCLVLCAYLKSVTGRSKLSSRTLVNSRAAEGFDIPKDTHLPRPGNDTGFAFLIGNYSPNPQKDSVGGAHAPPTQHLAEEIRAPAFGTSTNFDWA